MRTNRTKDGLVFQYRLYATTDPYSPMSEVAIYDDKTVIYNVYPEKEQIIHTKHIDSIIRILKNDELYNDERYLYSPLDMGIDFPDNYAQEFYISDGIKTAEYSGDNMYYFIDQHEIYPLAALLIDTLYAIRSILVPEGVDRGCFVLA